MTDQIKLPFDDHKDEGKRDNKRAFVTARIAFTIAYFLLSIISFMSAFDFPEAYRTIFPLFLTYVSFNLMVLLFCIYINLDEKENIQNILFAIIMTGALYAVNFLTEPSNAKFDKLFNIPLEEIYSTDKLSEWASPFNGYFFKEVLVEEKVEGKHILLRLSPEDTPSNTDKLADEVNVRISDIIISTDVDNVIQKIMWRMPSSYEQLPHMKDVLSSMGTSRSTPFLSSNDNFRWDGQYGLTFDQFGMPSVTIFVIKEGALDNDFVKQGTAKINKMIGN